MGAVDLVIGKPVCDCCEIYKDRIEELTQERNYFQTLLLERVGAIRLEVDEKATLEEFGKEPIRRVTRLSAIRHAAEQKSRELDRQNKAVGEPKIASPAELTEAERIFQKSVNDVQTQ